MPKKDAAPSPRSRYPRWVQIPAWISGITAIVSVILLALAIAWPLLFRGADGAFMWVAVVVAYGIMIVAWIVWAILTMFVRKR